MRKNYCRRINTTRLGTYVTQLGMGSMPRPKTHTLGFWGPAGTSSSSGKRWTAQ